MGKGTTFRYNLFQQRGSTLTKDDDYTITSNDLLVDGYGHFTQTGSGKTFTLPAASTAFKGLSIYITSLYAGTTSVTVSGGFGGGGASYTTATLQAYETGEFWCDGTYFYALNDSVA